MSDKLEKYLNGNRQYKLQTIHEDLRPLKYYDKPTVDGVVPSGHREYGGHGPLGSCGAAIIRNLGYGIYETELERQEFVLQLYRMIRRKVLFFLPTDAQINWNLGNPVRVLNILINQMGAKEIYRVPNRMHGPNTQIMYALDPEDPDVIRCRKKMLVQIGTEPGFYGIPYPLEVPRVIAEQCAITEDCEFKLPPVEVVASKPVEVYTENIPKGPARDAWGMFVKVAKGK